MTTTIPTTPALDPFGLEISPADLDPPADDVGDYDCWAWLAELSDEEREAFERYGHSMDSGNDTPA